MEVVGAVVSRMDCSLLWKQSKDVGHMVCFIGNQFVKGKAVQGQLQDYAAIWVAGSTAGSEK